MRLNIFEAQAVEFSVKRNLCTNSLCLREFLNEAEHY
jgi:hypothetical protein